MPNKRLTAREILSENLRALMAVRPDLDSQPKIAARAGIKQSSVGRIIRGEVECKIDSVDGLARAFGLETWQLLLPGLDVRHPPILRSINDKERALYERLKVAAQDIANYSQDD